MFTKAESAQPYKYRLFAVTGNCWWVINMSGRLKGVNTHDWVYLHSGSAVEGSIVFREDLLKLISGDKVLPPGTACRFQCAADKRLVSTPATMQLFAQNRPPLSEWQVKAAPTVLLSNTVEFVIPRKNVK
jgi:hypothetical protein